MDTTVLVLCIVCIINGCVLIFLLGQFRLLQKRALPSLLEPTLVDRIHRSHVALVDRVSRDSFDASNRDADLSRAVFELDANLHTLHDYCVALGERQNQLFVLIDPSSVTSVPSPSSSSSSHC
jgi:hypothetical protein